MRLELYLKISKTTIDEFAKMIGVKSSTVRAYLYNESKAGEEIMKKIYIATLRAVDANDFYKLPLGLNMRLEEWLKRKKIKISTFAKTIGVERSTVRAYIYKNVKPGEEIMRKIYIATARSVDANSFYKLSDKLFEDLVKSPVKEVLHKDSFKY